MQLCASIVKMDGLGKRFRVQQAQLKVAEKRAVELFVLSEFVTSILTSFHPRLKCISTNKSEFSQEILHLFEEAKRGYNPSMSTVGTA